ncbi:histidinol-phosphate transaminase [Candidatus Wirthbacteria bacterium CG2_30_54_11]|uniref:Histidinol-phosphate aminotransferase n=1 Tax=Candidatus Wirthbacteria bacterium CG2_30_54_11 TaxID=1817892 RepID=A0A1J5II00_9BACT|nr:MAG: histidinol-phosphate transaminase [Candidatus Wirthbacteria bacterium CG2_30_54_11]
MNKSLSYLKPYISKIEPYQWEDSEDAVKQKYGLDRILHFDTNTAPTPPPCYDRWLEILKSDRKINEYKDFTYETLQALLASYTEVPKEQVVVTASGDEGIDILSKATLGPGDRFVISSPTYSMYKIQGTLMGAEAIDVPLRAPDFTLDETALIAATQTAKLLYICNPNNPIGTLQPRSTVERIISSSPCLVVVDEAYFEFGGESVQDLVLRYDNLVILRTFSKFAALAGARVGYLITNPTLADSLNAIRFPMGISYPSMEIARLVLTEDREWIRSNVSMIKLEREQMQNALTALGLQVYPSSTNFLLVRLGEQAERIVQALKEQGLLVRNYAANRFVPLCVRITIRSPEENAILLQSLKGILNGTR